MKLLLLIAAAVVGNTAGAHVRISTSFLNEQSHIQCNEPQDQSNGCPEDRIPYVCPEATPIDPEADSVLLCCMWDHLPEKRKQKVKMMKDVDLDGYGKCITRPHWGKCWSCPTDDSYSDECVNGVMPPYPICCSEKRTTVQEWVEYAVDTATRCCKADGDLSECMCPVKDTDKFLDNIGNYCDAVDICEADEQSIHTPIGHQSEEYMAKSGKVDVDSDDDDKDFEVRIRIPNRRRDGQRDKRIEAKFEYQDGRCIQSGDNVINVPYTSDTTLKECGQLCLQDDDCKSIAYFVADVEPFERDGSTVRSKAEGDCILFSSVTGAVDCDEEYIGKYELYFRDDEIMYAMA